MENFKKKYINIENISELDLGIKVSDLIKIVSLNELSSKIFDLLNIEEIKNEFIAIKGAKTLVDNQVSLNKRFKKEDLQSSLENISLYNDKKFSINFNNIQNNEYFADLKLKNISTIPIYSAKRDFFSGLFQMDKYATKLIDRGYQDIIETNLKLIKEKHKSIKKYRILHDRSEDLFYSRAIISVNNYFDYNNNVAVVVGLISLHNEMKKAKIEYKLKRCEYNESFIRMFFESSGEKKLDKIGYIKNIIEISNDEIKREALRFSGVCSIIFKDKENNDKELFIKPHEIKSKILSIKHNQIPKTAVQELANIDKADNIHSELFNDISKIANIKDVEQIKFIIRNKIEKVKTEEVKRYKIEIVKELNSCNVTNIIQLLTVFNKIHLLANEDIEATEYLRYIIYQALIEKK
jgi:hypothetical protein